MLNYSRNVSHPPGVAHVFFAVTYLPVQDLIVVFFGMFCRNQLFLLLLLPLFLNAQEPAYLRYGVQDGLPGNVVYCGLQDKNGLLWFGTDKGLACYDGTRFYTFGMSDGLSDPEVLNLMEDHKGNLWISCFRKKPNCRRNGRIYNEKTDTLLNHVFFEVGIADFYETGDSIWITGVEDKFFRIDAQGLHHFRLALVSAARFASIGGRRYLFGTRSILEYQNDSTFSTIHQFMLDSVPNLRFMGFEVSGNKVLISWADRLVLLERKGDRFVQLDERFGVAGRVFTGSDGSFWVCSPNMGALRFESGSTDLDNPEVYLKGYTVVTTFEDHQRTRWFGTVGQGLYALPANAPILYTQTTDKVTSNITALFGSNDGRLYTGDFQGDVMVYHQNTLEQKFNLRLNNSQLNKCRQIEILPDGTSWFATDLGVLRHKQNQMEQIGHNDLVSAKALLYNRGKLWAATFSRVVSIDPTTLEISTYRSRRFTSLATDAQDNVWAGGIDGLYSLRDSFVYNWGTSFAALNNRISVMTQGDGKTLWVATPELGLLRLTVDQGTVQQVEIINDSLQAPIQNIVSLYKSPDGRLWLATNKGVYGLTAQWNTVFFDHNDGLPSNDVNAVVAYGDTLWIGTVAGLVRFTLSLDTVNEAFSTLISALHYQSDNKLVSQVLFDSPYDTVWRLPSEARLVSVDLAGLDFRSAGARQFICRLSQPLAPWTDLTVDNFFGWVFNGFKPKTQTRLLESGSFNFGVELPPGYYILEAVAVNNRGVESLKSARIKLIMPARWYETIWFWLLVWSTLGFFVYKTVNTQSAIHRLRASISELQLQALQSQINPHFIGNAINSVQQFFYPPDPAKASEYVALLTRMLRRTLEFSERSFIHFGDEVAYDSDYLELNRLRFGEHLVFSIEGADAIDPQTPFPSMMLQLLLENATIHGIAPDGNTVLNLRFEMIGKKLVCTLTDNGIGINAMQQRPAEHGRVSKGLQMLHKKAETINQLYGTNMTLHTIDLGKSDNNGSHGTQVVLAYEPMQVNSMRSRGVRRLLFWLFKNNRP